MIMVWEEATYLVMGFCWLVLQVHVCRLMVTVDATVSDGDGDDGGVCYSRGFERQRCRVFLFLFLEVALIVAFFIYFCGTQTSFIVRAFDCYGK